MRIAVQGDPVIGKQVIEFLEELGGYNQYGYTATDRGNYYFITGSGYISCAIGVDDLPDGCKPMTLDEAREYMDALDDYILNMD